MHLNIGLILVVAGLASAAATKPKVPKPTKTSCRPCKETAPTICVDYVNECGMMYGGCFPDCKPWPVFTPPVCPPKTYPQPPKSYRPPPKAPKVPKA